MVVALPATCRTFDAQHVSDRCSIASHKNKVGLNQPKLFPVSFESKSLHPTRSGCVRLLQQPYAGQAQNVGDANSPGDQLGKSFGSTV